MLEIDTQNVGKRSKVEKKVLLFITDKAKKFAFICLLTIKEAKGMGRKHLCRCFPIVTNFELGSQARA